MDSRPRTAVFTIGHSNHSFDKFVEMLKAHEVQLVVDVRTIPRSLHNPQFNTDILTAALQADGIDFHHLPALGGLRHPKKDSLHSGWENDSFRGFADYMHKDGFASGLSELLAMGEVASVRPLPPSFFVQQVLFHQVTQ